MHRSLLVTMLHVLERVGNPVGCGADKLECAVLCLCVAAMALWGPSFDKEQVDSALAGNDPAAVSCLLCAQLQPH